MIRTIVSITLDPKTLKAVDARAKREARSRSALVEILLKKALAEPAHANDNSGD